jgi:hypothetical protein
VSYRDGEGSEIKQDEEEQSRKSSNNQTHFTNLSYSLLSILFLEGLPQKLGSFLQFSKKFGGIVCEISCGI